MTLGGGRVGSGGVLGSVSPATTEVARMGVGMLVGGVCGDWWGVNLGSLGGFGDARTRRWR